MESSSSALHVTGVKSVEQLSKQLKTNMVDSFTLQKLIECNGLYKAFLYFNY